MNVVMYFTLIIGCLHDPANVQQTCSKCIQNTRELLDVCWKFAGRMLDRVNTPLFSVIIGSFSRY